MPTLLSILHYTVIFNRNMILQVEVLKAAQEMQQLVAVILVLYQLTKAQIILYVNNTMCALMVM